MAQVPNTSLHADIVSAITDCCAYNGEQYLIKLNLFQWRKAYLNQVRQT